MARLQWRVDQSKGTVSDRSMGEALRLLAAAPADHVKLIAAHHPLTDEGLDEPGHGRG